MVTANHSQGEACLYESPGTVTTVAYKLLQTAPKPTACAPLLAGSARESAA